MCGEEDCDAGEYCYGGQCSPDPLACVEDAFVRVPTTCMCGEVACSGYCFDGLCEAEPRGKLLKLFESSLNSSNVYFSWKDGVLGGGTLCSHI